MANNEHFADGRNNLVTCVLCGTEREGKTLPFGAVCEKCDCWLHSCVQCALWDSQAQICRSMTTDSVADRNSKNFCEEWKAAHKNEVEADTTKYSADKFSSLFGD